MKYLIACLGNTGAQYENTRHNIGFMIADAIASRHDATFSNDRHAHITEIKHKGRNIHIIKPTTLMNASGKAVNYWLQSLKIPPEQLLVITDDVNLPFGKIRIKAKGSAGGHNGLADIEQTLGHNKYPRLRFGVGGNYPKGQQIKYVLSPFSHEEEKQLPDAIKNATDAVYSFCSIGIERTMNFFN